MKKLKLITATALSLIAVTDAAVAHTGHGTSGLASGLTHPMAGLDHLLAMLAVGVWAATQPVARAWQGPALFVLLPVFLTVAFWIPQARTIVGGAVSLLGACGLLYLMAQTARRFGRSVERRMEDKAGRKHSARLLTHADQTIAAETKERYHAYLRRHGISI